MTNAINPDQAKINATKRLDLIIAALFGTELSREAIKARDSFLALNLDQKVLGYGEEAAAYIRKVAVEHDAAEDLVGVMLEDGVLVSGAKVTLRKGIFYVKTDYKNDELIAAAKAAGGKYDGDKAWSFPKYTFGKICALLAEVAPNGNRHRADEIYDQRQKILGIAQEIESPSK